MIKTLVCLTYKLGLGIIGFYTLCFLIVNISNLFTYIKSKLQ